MSTPKMKEHKHRYKINLLESVIGLKHAWITGKCVVCSLKLPAIYIDVDKLERTGTDIKTYWYDPA